MSELSFVLEHPELSLLLGGSIPMLAGVGLRLLVGRIGRALGADRGSNPPAGA